MTCYDDATWETATLVNVAQPGLVALLDYLTRRWPGGMSLGIHFDRPIRGGTSPSLHAEGRALDWRYADLPGGAPGIAGGRATVDSQVLPFLIDHCDLLGIQGIGDYIGPDGNGRFWKRCRSNDGSGKGWKPQAPSSTGWGQPWADWLHIEMDWAAARDARSIEDRLGFVPPPPPQEVHYLIGMKTIGDGLDNEPNHVACAQTLFNIRIGSGLKVDGIWGPKTKAAAQKYQGVVQLTADGIVGPQTWDRLGH